MLRYISRLSAAALLLCSSQLVPGKLVAQSSSPAPVCMARAGNNQDSPTFVAVIAPGEAAMMSGKGFVPHACQVDAAELATYRAKVCHLANDAPAEVQGQFEQQYNVSPRVLCDMANAVSGV